MGAGGQPADGGGAGRGGQGARGRAAAHGGGLQKVVVVTLKAVLAARGLDTSGQKAQLVARLLSVLQGE